MSNITVRQLEGEEIIDIAMPIARYAFGDSPYELNREEMLENLERYSTRYYAAVFDGDEPLATANNLNMTINIRGKIMDMSGVAGVAVYPHARRRGMAKRAVKNVLEYAHQQGQAVSTLYPFRESFYERLGYVGFSQVRMATLNPIHLGPAMHMDLNGHVELKSIEDGYEEWLEMVEYEQTQTHGMSIRERKSLDLSKHLIKLLVAVAKDSHGEVVGVLTYKIEGYAKEMKVRRFYYKNSLGKYLLLEWIARHADQVATATIVTKPQDKVETWLSDLYVEVTTQNISSGYSPTPQGRVVTVAGLNGIPVGEGRFTATINDTFLDWNNGTYEFASVDGELQVTPAESAECNLSIQALSGLIFGTVDPSDFTFRNWGYPDADLVETMRTMFPVAEPFLDEEF